MKDKLKGFKDWLDKDNGFPPEKWLYDWVKENRITLEDFVELLAYVGKTHGKVQ